MSSDSVLEAKRRWGAEQSEEARQAFIRASRRSGDQHALAQAIMGKNLLGLPEVSRCFGQLSADQISALGEIPFSEKTLRACSKTHILVADIGLSILDLRQKFRKGVFYQQDWFDSEEFAQETNKACWRLIRKTIVKDSTSNSWSAQKRLISDIDEIPSARQVVYMVLFHYLATEESLLNWIFVNTSSVSSSNSHVGVSQYDQHLLHISSYGGSYCHHNLGVLSAVRPQQSLIASRYAIPRC